MHLAISSSALDKSACQCTEHAGAQHCASRPTTSKSNPSGAHSIHHSRYKDVHFRWLDRPSLPFKSFLANHILPTAAGVHGIMRRLDIMSFPSMKSIPYTHLTLPAGDASNLSKPPCLLIPAPRVSNLFVSDSITSSTEDHSTPLT